MSHIWSRSVKYLTQRDQTPKTKIRAGILWNNVVYNTHRSGLEFFSQNVSMRWFLSGQSTHKPVNLILLFLLSKLSGRFCGRVDFRETISVMHSVRCEWTCPPEAHGLVVACRSRFPASQFRSLWGRVSIYNLSGNKVYCTNSSKLLEKNMLCN